MIKNEMLKEFKEVGNVRVFFRCIKKTDNEGKEHEFIDTLLIFPNNEDFLVSPCRTYSKKQKIVYREAALSCM